MCLRPSAAQVIQRCEAHLPARMLPGVSAYNKDFYVSIALLLATGSSALSPDVCARLAKYHTTLKSQQARSCVLVVLRWVTVFRAASGRRDLALCG